MLSPLRKEVLFRFYSYLVDFSQRKLLPLIAFTLVNYAISIEYFHSFPLFFIRETIIVLILMAIDYWGNELALLNKQDEEIHSEIYRKQPLLSYMPKLGFLTFICLIFVSDPEIQFEFPILVNLGLHFMGVLLFVFLTFYMVYINTIISSPRLRSYYDVVRAIKLKGLRSFGTVSSLHHICKLCLKGVAVVVGCDSIIPKIADGDVGSRGFLINYISEHFRPHGIKGRTSSDVREALYILDRYPEERSSIISVDNKVIARELPGIYRKYGLKPPGLFLETKIGVKHEFSIFDIFKKK